MRLASALAIAAGIGAGIAYPPPTYTVAPGYAVPFDMKPIRWVLRVTYTIDLAEYASRAACMTGEGFVKANPDVIPDGARRDANCEAEY